MKVLLFIFVLFCFLIGNIYFFFLSNQNSLSADVANDGVWDRLELEIRALKKNKKMNVEDKRIGSLKVALIKVMTEMDIRRGIIKKEVSVAEHILNTPYPKDLVLSKKYQKILKTTGSPRAFEVLIALKIGEIKDEFSFIKATAELYENKKAADDLFLLLDEFSKFDENNAARVAIYQIASDMPEIGSKIYNQVLGEFSVEDWKVSDGKLKKDTKGENVSLVAYQAFLNIAPDAQILLDETVRFVVSQSKISDQQLLIEKFLNKYPGLKDDVFLRLNKLGVNTNKFDDEND